MTTNTLTPTRALSVLLPLLARGRGHLAFEARSQQGYGVEHGALASGSADVPVHWLELIRDGWNVRVSVATRDATNGQPVSLPAAYVVWRPTPRFDASTGWRHAIDPDAQAQIAQAIAGCPVPPSALIDAGPEVVGLWLLDPAADLSANLNAARNLLTRMADALGASRTAATDIAGLTIPIAGPVRNWNTTPADLVSIVMIDPSRTYTFNALTAAFAGKGDPK